MKNIITLTKKELQSYLTTPVGYIFGGLFFIVSNWLFWKDIFISNQANLTPYWSIMAFLLAIFIPAISMGLIAEEKKNSTWEILFSLPVTEKQLVLGKYLGSGLYLLFVMFLSVPTILSLYFLGKPDTGSMLGGLMGIAILCLTYLSIGIFMSSLSNQPIVGFLSTAVILIINNLLGQELLLSNIPAGLKDLISNLSFNGRMSRFYSGVIEISDVVFFFSTILIFLTLTVLSLKSRNK